jgi:hypothetical protein
MDFLERYKIVRKRTEDICKPLETEDFVVQPIADVSPPKWHIGHTTWFFETFILKRNTIICLIVITKQLAQGSSEPTGVT